MTLPYKAPGWKTAPISCTCEHLGGSTKQPTFCGQPTDYAYPAMGGGWQALCTLHARPHMPRIFPIEEVIASGEVFA